MTREQMAADADGPVKLSIHELPKTRSTGPRTQEFVRAADEVTL